MAEQDARPADVPEGFELGAPALVCRWRLAKRTLPAANRHLRALGARTVNGRQVTKQLVGWAKQHIEWTLEAGSYEHPDGTLMLVIDEAGQAAMTLGPYEPLADTSAAALAGRALVAAREASSTCVAPEVLWAVRDGALVRGASADAPAAGIDSLVLDLARTRHVEVTCDPALASAVAEGAAAPADVLLVSDEHGVVPAAGATSELVRSLAEGYARLLDAAC